MDIRIETAFDRGIHARAEGCDIRDAAITSRVTVDWVKTTKFVESQASMGTIELKSNLYKILDRIENEQLLRAIYDFLKQKEDAVDGQIWKTLTEEQKSEVYLSYRESEDDANLIDWDDIKKKP